MPRVEIINLDRAKIAFPRLKLENPVVDFKLKTIYHERQRKGRNSFRRTRKKLVNESAKIGDQNLLT